MQPVRKQVQGIAMDEKRWIKWMEWGSKLGCHQMPERSFFYKGFQFPVCARCTGVLLSTVPAVIVFCVKKLSVKVCALLSSVMFLDWVVQFLEIRESTNIRRLITGLIGGFGVTTLHLHVYRSVARGIRRVAAGRWNRR